MAFVKFLENESQKEPTSAPTLLNIVHTTTASSNTASHSNVATTTATSSTTNPTPTTQPVQPLITPLSINQSVYLSHEDTFTTSRNSSSILKDVLNDS